MGKRRERRLAAMIGAGRRVKLDLFAEPSGDLVGSSAKDEVGKDVDANAELSNSPSSSGQKEDNPLSLLGQYSDDELDQGSNEAGSVQKDSLVGDDKLAKESVGIPADKAEVGDGEDPTQKADSCNPETDSAVVSDSQMVEATADENHHDIEKENIDNVPDASNGQAAEGVSSCWKLVLHEESNQYYYWNTVTGETCWEVPDALSQGTGTASGLETLGTEVKENGSGVVNAVGSAFGVKSDDYSSMHSLAYSNGVPDVSGVCEHGLQENQYADQNKGGVTQLLGSSGQVSLVPCETATLVNYSHYNQVDAGVMSASAVGYVAHGGYPMMSEQATIDPLQLISHGEALLDRLKSLQWCGFDSDDHSWISKYIAEVEIRLSDIRSLLPHGSSLVPFWQHSESQLNQVENGINTEIEKQKNKISQMHSSSGEGNKEMGEDKEQEPEVNADMGKLSPEKSSRNVHDTDASVVQESLHDEASYVETSNPKQVSVESHSAHLEAVDEGGKETDVITQGKESPKSEFQSGEDVDMDIDMEVEDTVTEPNGTIDMGAQTTAPSEQLAQPNVSMASEALEPGEFIPPPPDEEWIPPPPPDNEGIPPPPPDEPPESLCPPPPPAGPEPVQSVYSDRYNLAYAESNANYYGNPTTSTQGTTYYEHAHASQMPVLHPPLYYAAVSNAQPASVPAPANSVMYYGLQNGGMPAVPVDSSAGSLGFQATPGLVTFDPMSSSQNATVDATTGTSLLSNQFVEAAVPGFKTDASSTEASTSVVSAPATVSVKGYISAPSFSTSVSVTSTSAVPDTSTAVPKTQKAVRMKKPKFNVASSLRSNKKVSSLVDKWKAAKEELEEEEEEVRETPLEILEKKRQREIEEWRAQQIVSGEAKENANFQPLGGDWREKVKRRRAQKEAGSGTSTSSSDAIDNQSKQPNLDELSRDLPPGWQAYWDDTSKQVYYGNSITSETGWTKPTR